MTRHDANEVQRKNAERFLQQRIQLIRTATGPRSNLRSRFRIEIEEWNALIASEERNKMRSSVLEAEGLFDAWESVDPGAVRYLDLLVMRSDSVWRRWLAVPCAQVDTLSQPRYETREPTSADEFSLLLQILSAAEEYEIDLPGTPAEWRSLTTLNRVAPYRLNGFTELLNYSYYVSAKSPDGL